MKPNNIILYVFLGIILILAVVAIGSPFEQEIFVAKITGIVMLLFITYVLIVRDYRERVMKRWHLIIGAILILSFFAYFLKL